jgi:deoxyadenosine/deoxycytidine kinase
MQSLEPSWFPFVGTIGEGKSTMLEKIPAALHRVLEAAAYDNVSDDSSSNSASLNDTTPAVGAYSVDILTEDVERWKPLLVDYYKNPLQNAYALQTQVYSSSIRQHKEMSRVLQKRAAAATPIAPTVQYLLSERSPLCNRCFEWVQYEKKYITPNQHDAYNDWVDMWDTLLPHRLCGVIYLRTSIDTCLERIATRGREGEKEGITREYMERLQRAHDAQFLTNTGYIEVGSDMDGRAKYRVPVLCVNNSTPLEHEADRTALLDDIARFIVCHANNNRGSRIGTDVSMATLVGDHLPNS